MASLVVMIITRTMSCYIMFIPEGREHAAGQETHSFFSALIASVAARERCARAFLRVRVADVPATKQAILGISSNFPIPLMGPVMRAFTFPRGREYAPANDKTRRQVSQAITTPSEVRALLTQNVFVSKDQNDRVNQISRAVSLACEADGYLAACRRAKRQPTPEEQAVIDEAEALREQIIQVDSFETLAGQNHREDWMKATWSVGPVHGSSQQQSSSAH